MENKKTFDMFPEDSPAEETPEVLAEELSVEEALSEALYGDALPAEEAEDDFSIPEIPEDDAEFQDALNALRAFSSRYDSAPDAEEDIEDPPIHTYASVTEDTVPFTAPIAPPADDMGATQKFTPISMEEESGDMPEKNPPRRRAPIRKGRPEPKKGYGFLGIPHIASTFIWLAIIVSIGISLGRILWVCAADLLAFGKPDKAITITIEEDDSIKDIAQKLKDSGIIRYPNLFVLFADITGKGDRVIPETYDLNSMYDYNALLKMMSYKPANTEVVELLIPEGYNCAQIFKLLDEKGVCSAEALEQYAANGELKDYWFLEDLPRGTKYCLEGYLYPDTYKFYKDADPQYVLQKFLNNFNTRFTEKMRNDFTAMQKRFGEMMKKNGYSTSYINSHKLTFHQFITLASLVEEEKANFTEGYTIASVFYNRLSKANAFPFLDCDPTVYYAMGIYYDRKPLSKEDLKFNSPYNTYVSRGLPPGPISNPGSYSLYAALYPTNTSYYYFVYDKSIKEHRFSKTLAEHNRWVAQIGAQK